MNFIAISVKKTEFTDHKTGASRPMFQVFCADIFGGVGSLFSSKECCVGDTVDIDIIADRDGKLVAKIKDIIPPNNQNTVIKK